MRALNMFVTVGMLAAIPAWADPRSLFDGKSLAGWQGDERIFRVESGAIVGGSLEEKIKQNEFLTSAEEFGDFELVLEFRILGDPKQANAGIQIRSRRIPNHHEMIGYQADIGHGYWGCLYDESRRNKVLAAPAEEIIEKALRPDTWNEYRIRCEGPRVQLWLNGHQTVDYTETDTTIEQRGLIGLQVHSGPPMEIHYRNIRIEVLPEKP